MCRLQVVNGSGLAPLPHPEADMMVQDQPLWSFRKMTVLTSTSSSPIHCVKPQVQLLGSCDLLDITQAFNDQENRCAPRVIS